MRILALEPYYGGSHRAFLDGWAAASRHDLTVLGLPARKWKWRMRHSAITFARQITERAGSGETWDLLFCSDMLDLAELKGLCPAVAGLPAAVYFHENQLTYPVQVVKERDLHFALTNFTTALAADRAWFNSAYHRSVFLEALPALFRRMPDHRPQEEIAALPDRCEVQHPGIDAPPPMAQEGRAEGPLRLLWAARWEHDKGPEVLFAALDGLIERGVEFRVTVAGEDFERRPSVFPRAHRRLGDRIDGWGFLPRDRYLEALARADVLISTARHEFFGLAVVEAVAAGAFPLLPRRLSYPEVMAALADDAGDEIFYDGEIAELTDRLAALAQRLAGTGSVWPGDRGAGRRAMRRYFWPQRAAALDRAAEALVGRTDASRAGGAPPPRTVG